MSKPNQRPQYFVVFLHVVSCRRRWEFSRMRMQLCDIGTGQWVINGSYLKPRVIAHSVAVRRWNTLGPELLIGTQEARTVAGRTMRFPFFYDRNSCERLPRLRERVRVRPRLIKRRHERSGAVVQLTAAFARSRCLFCPVRNWNFAGSQWQWSIAVTTPTRRPLPCGRERKTGRDYRPSRAVGRKRTPGRSEGNETRRHTVPTKSDTGASASGMQR